MSDLRERVARAIFDAVPYIEPVEPDVALSMADAAIAIVWEEAMERAKEHLRTVEYGVRMGVSDEVANGFNAAIYELGRIKSPSPPPSSSAPDTEKAE